METSLHGILLPVREVFILKLRTRINLSFFILVLMPSALMLLFLSCGLTLQKEKLKNAYGIDVGNLPPTFNWLIAFVAIAFIAAMIITAALLSLWLYNELSRPLRKLTNATRSIRDGNLDFQLQPEGMPELRELGEDFEEMRIQLKRANEEKVEFDRQNRELISNISHDLRTPITAVKGYVEGIMDGVADTPEKMDRYMQTIYNKTIEMDRLINELSFYSKISTNRIPYAFDRISVREFFGDAAEDLRTELESRDFTFSYENTVAEDVEVIADAEQISRVMNNIISNAEKYTDKPEKKISIRVSEEGNEVQVAVSDNGKGIEAKNIANVFERFYRTDSSRNSAQGGSGIGLSIVKKIIEDHGGRVWASSHEGEGTTIYFILRKYTDSFSSQAVNSEEKNSRRKRRKP